MKNIFKKCKTSPKKDDKSKLDKCLEKAVKDTLEQLKKMLGVKDDVQ